MVFACKLDVSGMAPVKVKFVVSFSSQDKRHTVDNILKGDGISKWLCSPDDRSGNMEAVFQLDRACKITNLDIGTYLTFTVHVSVACSSWPSTQPYVELLSGTIFSSVAECRFGKNKTCIRMFKYADFCEGARDNSWDRMKFVLTQPFRREVQFGLSLLRIATDEQSAAAVTSPSPGQAKQTPTPKSDRGTASAPVNHAGTGRPNYGPSWKSPSEIKKLFFKNEESKDKHKKLLVEHLSKIGASTADGSAESASMSRNLKLVVAAAGQTPHYKNSPPPIRPRAEIKRKKRTFEEEVQNFLELLDMENIDLDTTTFADLRHKLEKQKCRKLTKEERVVFKTATGHFLDNLPERGSSKKTAEKSEGNVKKRHLSDPTPNQSAKRQQLPPKQGQDLTETVSRVSKPEEARKSVLVDLTRQPVAQPKTNFSPSNLKSSNATSATKIGTAGRPVVLDADIPAGNDVSVGSVQYKSPAMTNCVGKSSAADAGAKKPITPSRKPPPIGQPVTKKSTVQGGAMNLGSITKPAPSPVRPVTAASPASGSATPTRTPVQVRHGVTAPRGRGSPRCQGASLSTSLPVTDTNDMWLGAGHPPAQQASPQVSSGGSRGNRGGRKSRGRGRGRASLGSDANVSKSEKVPCPVCKKLFSARQVEMHAALCGVEISSDDDSDEGDVQYTGADLQKDARTVKCPICADMYPAAGITRHVDICIALSSRS